MNRNLHGVFAEEDQILQVTRACRERGYEIVDVYSPYPVHGMDRAMGLKPSRITWVCFVLGMTGAAAMLWFQSWASAVDWPANIGGKPLNSLPAFVPITFEVMVLFAGLSTVFAFFLVSRLRPGRKARLIASGVTNDRFALVLEQADAAFSVEAASDLLNRYNVVSVEERLEEVESS